MTGTIVVIPVRGLHGGKSRLASRLDPDQRATLIASMASQTIDAVARSGVAESIIVVSRDPDLLLRLQGDTNQAELVPQHAQSIGLNAAIDLGRREALDRNAERLLVLSADLPLITSRAITDVVTGGERAGVMLGTDGAGLGTNALALRGTSLISRFTFQFGPDSRRLHRREAERLGADVVERDDSEIALDLDTPDDWAMLSGEMRQQLLNAMTTSRPSFGAIVTDPVALLERA